MTEKPPAGWYPDNNGASRWWDGDQWSEHTQPPAPTQNAQAETAPDADHTAEAAASGASPVRTRADAKAEKAYAKASRPWYKKKRFIIPIALVVLIGIVAAVGGETETGPTVVGGGDSSSENSSSEGDGSSGGSNKAGSKSNPLAVGQTVELEGTRYTVESAKRSQRVGGQFFQEKANGVFVTVELTVENKKNETKTFSDEAAKFISTDDKRYSTDSDGTIASAGEGDESFLLMDMQPDVPESGILVYDVPNGKAKGGLLEVRDLFGGGEAYIDLGL